MSKNRDWHHHQAEATMNVREPWRDVYDRQQAEARIEGLETEVSILKRQRDEKIHKVHAIIILTGGFVGGFFSAAILGLIFHG